jgi:hypothetical protein
VRTQFVPESPRGRMHTDAHKDAHTNTHMDAHTNAHTDVHTDTHGAQTPHHRTRTRVCVTHVCVRPCCASACVGVPPCVRPCVSVGVCVSPCVPCARLWAFACLCVFCVRRRESVCVRVCIHGVCPCVHPCVLYVHVSVQFVSDCVLVRSLVSI